ncbi:MAG: hypothetical protein ACFFBS_07265 [Promethearchaeota archaeon]
MAVKKSLEEMVEIMLRNGMSKRGLKGVLQNIGFSDNRIDKALAKTGLIDAQLRNDETPEGVQTQTNGLQDSENLAKNSISNQEQLLLTRLENVENSLKLFEAMTDKIEEIEKKVDLLFGIIGEYVPQILKKTE